MSDDEKIAAHLASLPDGALMSDACARMVAVLWHGGQSSALYALGSSGAITEDAGHELREQDRAKLSPGDRAELDALLTYVEHHGVRGPVAGWASLWL
jgi:hypothetical protein